MTSVTTTLIADRAFLAGRFVDLHIPVEVNNVLVASSLELHLFRAPRLCIITRRTHDLAQGLPVPAQLNLPVAHGCLIYVQKAIA